MHNIIHKHRIIDTWYMSRRGKHVLNNEAPIYINNENKLSAYLQNKKSIHVTHSVYHFAPHARLLPPYPS